MGLLSKVEAVRNNKLHKADKDKKKYIHEVSPARKKVITQVIRKDRKKIVKHLGKALDTPKVKKDVKVSKVKNIKKNVKPEKPLIKEETRPISKIKLISAITKVGLRKLLGRIKVGGLFKWQPEMSVNEDKIDEQHQTLINQVNKLTQELSSDKELPRVRETVNFLGKYVVEHFTYEEAYMKKHGYPGLKEHQKIHNEFIKFFQKYKKDFNKELYSPIKPGEKISNRLKKISKECQKFLGDWVVNHILKVDQKFVVYINKKLGKTSKKIVEKPAGKKLFDISSLKAEIQSEMQRKHTSAAKKGYIYTGVPGFDDLLDNGIPKNASVLVAGGAGSGKTIFCLQTLFHHLAEGKKCIMMSFEESEEKLISHMEQFGWNPKKYIKKGQFYVKRFNPFEITRSVDALLMQAKGELMIKVDPLILPKGFKPDFIVVDSLTAIASAFTAKDESYRIYIEQLFRFFENINATALLITETEQVPKIFSTTGVEEFLADGVVIIYNIKHGNIRERAIEILKLRGASHQNKIVAMSIGEKGVTVYPEQEVFGEIQGP